jgi:hypothetical protein
VGDTGATIVRRTELRLARPGLPRLDLGPSRTAYEELWTGEASTILARLLLGLPHGLRSYAKREVHRRIDAGPSHAALDERALAAAIRDVLAQLAPR